MGVPLILIWIIVPGKKCLWIEIFGESNELVNIAKHPMALWKCRNKAEDKYKT